MKIYVASSWRNTFQPAMVKTLRDYGHEVYDFRNPPHLTGFAWSEIGLYPDDKKQVNTLQYMTALEDRRAVEGFNSDFDAMKWADACVLVLPCGKSAHLELGWAVGAGKRTAIYCPTLTVEPELMVKMTDLFTDDLDKLVDWLESLEPATANVSA